MSHDIHSETVERDGRTYTIRVYPDEDVESPLDGDVVRITYRAGSSYKLGNVPLEHWAHKQIAKRIEAFDNPGVRLASHLEGEDAPEPLIGMAVHAYVHSSIHLSTTSWHGRAQHAAWDSGQSGFVYITPKDALVWQGGKRLTKRKVARMRAALSSMVEEYGRWLNGECYYFTVEDESGEVLDSCGGFIGYEHMLNEAHSYVDSAHRAALKEESEKRYWHERDVPTVSA